MIRPLAALMAGLAAVLAAQGALADAKAGRQLAERWCAQCHIVAPEQASGLDAAPPFSEIAAAESWTDGALRTWLTDPHPPMPNVDLETREIESIIDYLKSF